MWQIISVCSCDNKFLRLWLIRHKAVLICCRNISLASVASNLSTNLAIYTEDWQSISLPSLGQQNRWNIAFLAPLHSTDNISELQVIGSVCGNRCRRMAEISVSNDLMVNHWHQTHKTIWANKIRPWPFHQIPMLTSFKDVLPPASYTLSRLQSTRVFYIC